MIIIAIIALVAVIVVWFITIYNGLVKMRNRVEEAWSDIDVQLKRRYDLIPNVIETVKGYAGHEREVFENVTKARASALEAEKSGDPKKSAEAENILSGTLKTLFAVAENYPDLKANQNFLELQEELADTENKIQSARRFYNANVRDFNTKQEVFPSNIVASMFGFKKSNFFEIEEEKEKEVPKVSFKNEVNSEEAGRQVERNEENVEKREEGNGETVFDQEKSQVDEAQKKEEREESLSKERLDKKE